jgi:hypothetical protein
MLPAGATFTCCDILDASSVTNAVDSARQLVMAIGFAYEGSTWRASWPRATANLLAACEVARARLRFVDNLYMYGPQQEPLREDMPLADYGINPAVSAAITRQWQTAHRAGRVKVAALRAPDFYGPEVSLSHLGDVGFGALAKRKRVTLIAPPAVRPITGVVLRSSPIWRKPKRRSAAPNPRGCCALTFMAHSHVISCCRVCRISSLNIRISNSI